jgi:hypothetical protein
MRVVESGKKPGYIVESELDAVLLEVVKILDRLIVTHRRSSKSWASVSLRFFLSKTISIRP